MHIAGMILGCLLLSQAPDARLRPPEMVAEAIRLPSGSPLTGQPLTLLSVLASTPDRRQQLEMTRAYWRLAQAVAEYHFCLDHSEQLERIKPAGDEPASLRLARASAAAMLSQAELEATSAQCELARLVRLAPGAPLPLPADRPHVGPYRTNFQELFAGRTPPEPAALMERILPIRRQAVDDQAAAVQAAEDVLAAAAEQSDQRRGRLATCSQELLRQQRAFIHTVCDYNRNIAEYGLAVAGPATSPQALAAMLIGPAQPASAPAVARNVRPAGASEPIASPTRQPSRRADAGPAARRREEERTDLGAAARRSAAARAMSRRWRRRATAQPVGKNEPTLAPPPTKLQDEPTPAPRRKAPQEPASVENKPLVPVEQPSGSPPAPQPRTANKPVIADQRQGASGEIADVSATSPLYPAWSTPRRPSGRSS